MRGARIGAAVTALLVALPLSACGVIGPRGCTAVGCTSAVSVDLTGTADAYVGATATLCVADRCSTTELARDLPGVTVLLGPDNAGPDEEFSTDEPLPVHLTIVQGSEVLLDTTSSATLVEYQPNGDRCEPTCFVAGFVLGPDGLREIDPIPER